MIITGGFYRGRKISTPDEKIVRPTLSKAREAIFSVLYSMIDFEDKSFLDMFAGSGIMGLEALSRGFGYVLELEKSPKVTAVLKDNYKKLGLVPEVLVGDSLKTGAKINKCFNVVYIDPPYMSGIYEKSLEVLKNYDLIDKNSIVILEHIVNVGWDSLGFKVAKQKSYSQKKITFLELE